MEPLHKDVKQAILDANPQAQPDDIEEYERLLSQRFARDPDAPNPEPRRTSVDEEEARLLQLHRKLFPAAVTPR